jgi:hypothetical protein
MTVRNNHWYDLNDQRKHPLSDTASCVSDAGELLPPSLLADLHLRWPNIYGRYGFVSACSISPQLVTVLFAATHDPADPNAAVTLIAGYTGLRDQTASSRAYPLQSFCGGSGGFVVFGQLPDYLYSGRFSLPRQSLLSPKAAWGVRQPPVRTLGVEHAADSFVRLVQLAADSPLEIVKESRVIGGVLQPDVVVFRLQEQAQPLQLATRAETVLASFAGPCGARVGTDTCGDPKPLLSINGVAPDCDGVVTLDFRNCAVVGRNTGDCGVVIDCEVSLDQVCAPAHLPALDTGELPYEIIPNVVIPPPPPPTPEPPPTEVSESLSVTVGDEFTLPYCESFDTMSGGLPPANFSFLSGAPFSYVADDSPANEICRDAVSESSTSSSSLSHDLSTSSSSLSHDLSTSSSSLSHDLSTSSSSLSHDLSTSSSSQLSTSSSSQLSTSSSSLSHDLSTSSSSLSHDLSTSSSSLSHDLSTSSSSQLSTSSSSQASLSSEEYAYPDIIEWKLFSAEVYDPLLPVSADQIVTSTSPFSPSTLRLKLQSLGAESSPPDHLDYEASKFLTIPYLYMPLNKEFEGYDQWNYNWTGDSTSTWGARYSASYYSLSGGSPAVIGDPGNGDYYWLCGQWLTIQHEYDTEIVPEELGNPPIYFDQNGTEVSCSDSIGDTVLCSEGWCGLVYKRPCDAVIIGWPPYCEASVSASMESVSSLLSESLSLSTSISTSTSVSMSSTTGSNSASDSVSISLSPRGISVNWQLSIYREEAGGYRVRGICTVHESDLCPPPDPTCGRRYLYLFSHQWFPDLHIFDASGTLHLDLPRDAVDYDHIPVPALNGLDVEGLIEEYPSARYNGLRVEADIRWTRS